MKKNSPLVSVVIPVYNAEKYIEEALESILNQTYKNLEIIVSNDGSTDNSIAKVKKYKDKRIQIVEAPKNQGVSAALNRGVLASTGKYIAIMDADDWSYPYRIEKQVKLMEENPKVVLSSGDMDMCDEEMNFMKTRKYPLTNSEIRKVLLKYDPIVHAACIWRREALLKTDLYPLYVKNTCHDYCVIFQIAEYGEFKNLPISLLKCRIRDNSITGNKTRQTQLFSTYFQIKAIVEQGFHATTSDKFFIFARTCSAFILPSKLQRYIASRVSVKR